MGLFEKLRQELIDIVEWVDDTHRTLVWRFPRYQNEIKHGAQLIVRPGQKAIFIDRGKVADVFEPGMYTLDTANLPILSTLQGWKYGFESPFKAEVYFVSTRQITDLKWGTPNPVMMRDADFGPIRIRAFGTYALKAQDPKALLEELVGTDGIFEAEEVTELLRSIVVSAFADMLGEAKIAALDLAGNYTELSEELRRRTQERVDDEYGLEIPQLYVVNISLPEEVEKALDTRTSMGVIGDMGAFQQYQMGQAMTAAANNPSGGGAAEGMGLGMGFAMANQMFGAGGGPGAQVGPGQMAPGAAGGGAAPPPLPPASPWHAAVGGQSVGPMPLAQLVQQIQGGQIERETLVWTAGMEAWSPAGDVPQLAGYFQATPPPLPQS
ncbi:MAG: SPFH domain-containing protein [Acidobacteriota bacterium]|nr:SPFH domain-containing protein [Acidobacteriota bacterium]